MGRSGCGTSSQSSCFQVCKQFIQIGITFHGWVFCNPFCFQHSGNGFLVGMIIARKINGFFRLRRKKFFISSTFCSQISLRWDCLKERKWENHDLFKAGAYKSWKYTVIGCCVFIEWVIGSIPADVDYAGCVFENYRQNRGTEECINALINLTMNWMLPVIVVFGVVGAVCAIWR